MVKIADDPRFQLNQQRLKAKADAGTRVIGGQPVPPGQFLDCVAVGCARAWDCTGTLIAPRVVVSAAHCVRCASFVFFGNDVRPVPPGDTSHPSVVAVEDRVRHPDYHGGANDLLVLILAKPVNVEPRRLAATAQIDDAPEARVMGFGWIDERERKKNPGEKRFVDLPIASPSCRGSLGGVADEDAYGCAPGLELVAKRNGRVLKDTCKGDSGGPLYIEEGGEWLLAAATSRATKGTARLCGDGGIYTRLDAYRPWIESTAGVRL